MRCEGSIRNRLIESLDTWYFEPHKLPEEEVVTCSYILFEALYRIEGMHVATGVPLSKCDYLSCVYLFTLLLQLDLQLFCITYARCIAKGIATTTFSMH